MVSTFWNFPGIQSPKVFNILERSLSPICIYTDCGQLLYRSQSFLELLPASAAGDDFIAYFGAAGVPRPTLEQRWQDALQGHSVSFVTQVNDLDEPIDCCLQFDVVANLMLLTAKKVTLSSDMRRLTEDYERAIAALVRTEEKWQTFILNSPYLLIQVNNTEQIIYISPAVETLLGYQQEELLGRQITELIHVSHTNEFALNLQLWQHGIKTSNPGMECWWRTKAGQWVCLSMQGQPLPTALGIDGVVISGYNVTDRKYLEAELQASEERFRSLVLNVPGAVFRCDASYTMVFTSYGIERITGYPAATFLHNQGQSYLSIIYPDDITVIKDSLLQCVMDRYHGAIEYRVIHANGGIRWVSERKQGVFDQDGNLVWMDGVIMDISESKRLIQVPYTNSP